MNDQILLLIAGVALFFVLKDGDKPSKKPVTKKEKFEPRPSGVVATLYYADWCGHCQKFKPVWQFLESKMSNDQVQLNKVDCTNKSGSIRTPGGKEIQGFPTIVLRTKDGKEYEYEGSRDSKAVHDWIKSYVY